MEIRLHHAIEEIPADAWNAVAGSDYPFTRHEFLVALERHNCVGEDWGWLPHHIGVYENERLIGAAPLYLKTNSYGELVFDWAWEDAYRRHGLRYYPKLVSAIPYTPAGGPRLLVAADVDRDKIAAEIIQAVNSVAAQNQLSSVHWLFPHEEDLERLKGEGLMARVALQFHWYNQDYDDFDAFLATLSSKKRKNIRRERRIVRDQGINLRILHGEEISDEELQQFHRLYRSTFDRKSGYATLSLAFFREIAQTMPRNLVIILAEHESEVIAAAYLMRGEDTLYGRHWGCSMELDSLHFETCYYQGLEYCIANGLKRFDPGAQGEHKINRGFLPTKTWSAHWIAQPEFRHAIGEYLNQETEAMEEYQGELNCHSPYRNQDGE